MSQEKIIFRTATARERTGYRRSLTCRDSVIVLSNGI